MSFAFDLQTSIRTALVSSLSVTFVVAGALSPVLAQEHSSWIEDNETKKVTGYLLQGESVSGLCDEDCSDLDLFLYNEMGVMVDSDDGADANPIVTAPYEGTFVVEVAVPSCTHWAGCAVSIRSDQGF
ncbi:MAG: hypothetical protein AAF703_00020 [Cyanobacteria bacterium P01_D01_bin.105]